MKWLHLSSSAPCAALLAPLALLLALPGCPSPDLGEAPFLCHTGDPECPEGYVCQVEETRKICVKEGSEPPKLDSAPALPDAATDGPVGPNPDGAVPPKPDAAPTLPDSAPPKPDGPPATAGSVVVSEFLPNPQIVSDSVGEWLELHNPGGQAVDIDGWTLRDMGTDSHVINAGGPLLVPAGGYLVLGRSTDTQSNGGVNVAYAYSSFYLSNSADEVELVAPGGKVVDSFSYSSGNGFVIPEGASLSFKSGDKSLGASWCEESSPWSGSAGDAGSPGAKPGC